MKAPAAARRRALAATTAVLARGPHEDVAESADGRTA